MLMVDIYVNARSSYHSHGGALIIYSFGCEAMGEEVHVMVL